jgi:hypothetical protein
MQLVRLPQQPCADHLRFSADLQNGIKGKDGRIWRWSSPYASPKNPGLGLTPWGFLVWVFGGMHMSVFG